jgi:hypothetical protein
MATIITAPEIYRSTSWTENYVFLAGAIDMGAAVDWQSWVIEQLRGVSDLVLFNPRRAEFTPDTLDEQINWELRALHEAHTVFMWFPKDAKAPIALFEAGLYWRSDRLLIGAEEGFYRRRNLELTGKFYGTHIHNSLGDMVNVLLATQKA